MPESRFLVADGISKAFNGTQALDGATVGVDEGRFLALLGPSGCGKTTLLRVVAGLETPDTGTVRIGGELLTGPGVHVPAERRRVGMVFQDAALFPHLSVARNVAYGLSRAEVAAGRVTETLEMVALAHLAQRHPHELSGGQAQRVALASALAPRPRVLLFDEPFTGLDTELRLRVRTEMHALLRQVGTTSVFVTHDQEEAFVLGDRVAVVHEGRVRQEGTPAEVYAAPADPWVAGFVGEANLVPGHAEAGVATTLLGAVPVGRHATGEVTVLVRPEHLHVAPIETADASAGLEALVTDVAFYGHDSAYTLHAVGRVLQARAPSAPRFAAGERVRLRFAGPTTTAWPSATPETPETPETHRRSGRDEDRVTAVNK